MIRRHWPKSAVLAVALLSMHTAAAHAQLGGLKKKIKEQIAGKQAVTASPNGATAGSTPLPTSYYTPANRIAITPAVVDQFITGLRAEVAERDRIAAAKATDANVVKFWRRHDRKVYCDSLAKNADASVEAAVKAMQQASTEAQLSAATRRMQDANAAKNGQCDPGEPPDMVQSFFDNLRTAETGLDATGASAAGLSRGQYAYLRERIAALALLDARVTGPGGSGTPKDYGAPEMAAVRARAAVLVPLLLRDFIPTGERAPSSSY